MPVFLCSFDVLFLVVSLRDKVRDGHGCEVKGASDVQYDKFHLFAKGRDYPSTEKKKKIQQKTKPCAQIVTNAFLLEHGLTSLYLTYTQRIL